MEDAIAAQSASSSLPIFQPPDFEEYDGVRHPAEQPDRTQDLDAFRYQLTKDLEAGDGAMTQLLHDLHGVAGELRHLADRVEDLVDALQAIGIRLPPSRC